MNSAQLKTKQEVEIFHHLWEWIAISVYHLTIESWRNRKEENYAPSHTSEPTLLWGWGWGWLVICLLFHFMFLFLFFFRLEIEFEFFFFSSPQFYECLHQIYTDDDILLLMCVVSGFLVWIFFRIWRSITASHHIQFFLLMVMVDGDENAVKKKKN